MLLVVEQDKLVTSYVSSGQVRLPRVHITTDTVYWMVTGLSKPHKYPPPPPSVCTTVVPLLKDHPMIHKKWSFKRSSLYSGRENTNETGIHACV